MFFTQLALTLPNKEANMSLIILFILLLSYFLIATESFTKINKSAVAIFAGTVCWVLYISYGSDFVTAFHGAEYSSFLAGKAPSSSLVKQFIAQEVFIKYVGRACEIAAFLLATMTIVEILSNNGCFDFIAQLLQTRKSRQLLWIMSTVTLLISANLDNLTTSVMMLTMMHSVIPNRKQRMVFGAAIVLSANYGGALTVIGEPISLVLWNMEAVTATGYSMSLLLPCLVAWAVTVWMVGRMLPERIDHERIVMPYRGDDTRLNTWQRLTMLFVGFGGLWFIPSFHNITKLSPFLGALCVLSVLWIVDELMNHKLKNSDYMMMRRTPTALQYGTIQMILYVMGIMLVIGVVNETGVVEWIAAKTNYTWLDNICVVGSLTALMSTVLDNFVTAMSIFSFSDVLTADGVEAITDVINSSAALDSPFWTRIVYASVAGGNILCIGSLSGIALMKAERIHVGWYFRHIGLKALVGGLLGAAVFFIVS